MERPEVVLVALAATFSFSFSLTAKHFHRRMVSSAAMLATVWPSGDMHRFKMRPEWPKRDKCLSLTLILVN